MKSNSFRLIVSFLIVFAVSCEEPETVVTNFVHPDGSVTRRIEMRSPNDKSEDRFKTSDLQVPFDNTWTVRDSMEISDKGDTTWVRRAEKLFKNTTEIDNSYRNDSGANRGIVRKAEFSRKFRWFNTEYRFAEKIDKKMKYGYPIADFLNEEELKYFYSPESVKDVYQNGPDSLKYRAYGDTEDSKTDLWLSKSLVSEWIGIFSGFTEGKGGNDLSFKLLKAREDEFVTILTRNEQNFDSLWTNGILLRELIGEDNAQKFKTEADSAINIVTNNLLLDFKEYSVQIFMPGKLIGTNGFSDSSAVLMWPVESDFFLTDNYEMWAESRAANLWAWIVSGSFLLFVLTGLIIRKKKKG